MVTECVVYYAYWVYYVYCVLCIMCIVYFEYCVYYVYCVGADEAAGSAADVPLSGETRHD